MRISSRIFILLLALLMAGQTAFGQLDPSDMAADLDEAFTFTKYPNYFHYDTMMHQLAAEHPEICRIDTFGYSRQGRLLLALKISDNVALDEDEPEFLYTGTMHGDELVGYVLLLRFADFLLNNYGLNTEVTSLVSQVEIWINPLSNPDETFYPDDNYSVEYSRRPEITALDLNRNFPDPLAGDENDTTGLQLEIQNMMLFMTAHKFNMSANIHGGSEVVNYPWDHKYSRHPDNDWFIHISREYADLVHDVNPSYMDGFTDGITNGYDWYDIYGGRQDYTTYYLQGRELTLELSNAKKLPSALLETFWSYNQWSLFNLVVQSTYGIRGKVIDAETGGPLHTMVEVADHDNDSSVVFSDSIFGRFYRYLKEGNYDLVVSAEGYKNDTVLDVPIIDFQRTNILVRMDSMLDTHVLTDLIDPGINLYPNPASEYITIELNDPGTFISSIRIYSMDGKLISLLDADYRSSIRLDLSHFQNGIYLLKIHTKTNIYHKAMLIAH
jgi:hypothetical protein